MTKPGPSVSILAQLSGAKPFMFERMNALLDKEGLERFRAAVAYARWDGIGLIAPHIETFLKRGGEFQTIYGVANGVTTPDSLLYNLYLQEIFTSHTYAGAIEDQYVNATFHTKFFEFKFADKIIFIVGSANLTGAGMSRNTEMGAEVKIRVGSPLSKQTDDVWKSLRAASQKVTLALIRSSKDDGELGSEHQKNETHSNKGDKPRLRTGVKASPKPLFSKVLDLRQPTKKSKILAKLDTLTVQPQILHLQILTYETGGMLRNLGSRNGRRSRTWRRCGRRRASIAISGCSIDLSGCLPVDRTSSMFPPRSQAASSNKEALETAIPVSVSIGAFGVRPASPLQDRSVVPLSRDRILALSFRPRQESAAGGGESGRWSPLSMVRPASPDDRAP